MYQNQWFQTKINDKSKLLKWSQFCNNGKQTKLLLVHLCFYGAGRYEEYTPGCVLGGGDKKATARRLISSGKHVVLGKKLIFLKNETLIWNSLLFQATLTTNRRNNLHSPCHLSDRGTLLLSSLHREFHSLPDSSLHPPPSHPNAPALHLSFSFYWAGPHPSATQGFCTGLRNKEPHSGCARRPCGARVSWAGPALRGPLVGVPGQTLLLQVQQRHCLESGQRPSADPRRRLRWRKQEAAHLFLWKPKPLLGLAPVKPSEAPVKARLPANQRT